MGSTLFSLLRLEEWEGCMYVLSSRLNERTGGGSVGGRERGVCTTGGCVGPTRNFVTSEVRSDNGTRPFGISPEHLRLFDAF